jgi:hypothetical protein
MLLTQSSTVLIICILYIICSDRYSTARTVPVPVESVSDQKLSRRDSDPRIRK